MNFAATHKLAVIFLVENNGFAISVPWQKQMPTEDVADRARGYGIPGVIVDGCDAIACYRVARDAVKRARRGDGPTLIEAKVLRLTSHSSDDDQRRYRTSEDLESDKERDSLLRFRATLEELGVLAPGDAEEMRAELVEAHARLGITIIYVTHDQVEAMTMGHRIAIMNEGVLQQVDVPRVVHDRPANAFVAGFIGSPPMNILSATVVQGADAAAVHVSGGTLALPALQAAALRRRALTSAVIGIRPEALAIDPAGTVAATVSLVESLGHESHVACRLPDGQLVMIRLGPDQTRLHTGDDVALRATGELHLFDPATGARIDA